MELRSAIRKQQKLRLALMGKAGSGKTYSALLLAYGITGDWTKIAVIDTEDNSASLYSHLGAFNTVQLGAPFHPAKYYEALDLIEDSGIEVIIIDSLSPEWTGVGGVIEHLAKDGWEEAIRCHRTLLARITNSSCHVICTLRSRQSLVRMGGKGKYYWQLIERPRQQEGIEYPFTTVLRLSERHKALIVKDRTGVFGDKEAALIQVEHGAFLNNWCLKGEPAIDVQLQSRIDACDSHTALQELLFNEDVAPEHIAAFTKRRLELDDMIIPIDNQGEPNQLSRA